MEARRRLDRCPSKVKGKSRGMPSFFAGRGEKGGRRQARTTKVMKKKGKEAFLYIIHGERVSQRNVYRL